MAWAHSSAGEAAAGSLPPSDGARQAPRASTAGGEAPGRTRLRRYPDRGLLGGVGAGIAENLRVEVLIVRLVMAVIMTAGGVGIVLYALAWALIPVAPESEGVPRRRGAWPLSCTGCGGRAC
jgi:phage shock protein PspC (stress-responsive transcriptional regulator)